MHDAGHTNKVQATLRTLKYIGQGVPTWGVTQCHTHVTFVETKTTLPYRSLQPRNLFRPRDSLCAPANLDASSSTLTASSFAFTALGLVITLCPQVPFRLASSPATDDTQIARSHRLKLSRQQHTRHLASRPSPEMHLPFMGLFSLFPYPLYFLLP